MTHFSTPTGLWEFGGKSTHKPKEMKDIQLSRLGKSQVNRIYHMQSFRYFILEYYLWSSTCQMMTYSHQYVV